MIPGPETKMRREASQMLTAPKAAKIRKEIFAENAGRRFASEKETGDQTDKVRQDQSQSASGKYCGGVGKAVLRVRGGQCDGGKLCFVSQLSEKEGTENRQDRPEPAASRIIFFLLSAVCKSGAGEPEKGESRDDFYDPHIQILTQSGAYEDGEYIEQDRGQPCACGVFVKSYIYWPWLREGAEFYHPSRR